MYLSNNIPSKFSRVYIFKEILNYLRSFKLTFGSSIGIIIYGGGTATGSGYFPGFPPFLFLSANNFYYYSNSSYYFLIASYFFAYFSFSAYSNLFFISKKLYSSKCLKLIKLSTT